MALFKQIFANDANNPQNIAVNGVITIFAPNTRTVIALELPTGEPLPNPLPLNELGFGPAFSAEGYTQVAWEAVAPGLLLQGTFESYEGVQEVAEAAVELAEAAALRAEAAEASAAESSQFAQGPTDEQVRKALEAAARPSNLALAADGVPYILPGANEVFIYRDDAGNYYFTD